MTLLKRIFNVLLCLILIFTIVVPAGTEFNYAATTTKCTQREALEWVENHAKKHTPFDVDNIYGVQCADFGTAYINYIISGDYRLYNPYTTFNGCEYLKNINEPGWKKLYYNQKKFIPEPGDILVWNGTMNDGPGHVAVAVEGSTSTKIKCVDQSGSIQRPTDYSEYNYSSFEGAIRPLWKNGPAYDKPCNCSTEYEGEYVVTNNNGLNLRSGHSTDSEIIGHIPNNTIVYVSKADGKWAHVSYDGKNGLCSMKYLKNFAEPDEPVYNIKIWYSKSPNGDEVKNHFVNDRYYLCYEIVDAISGQKADAEKNLNYNVSLKLSSDKGLIKNVKFTNRDHGNIEVKLRNEDIYTTEIEVTGQIKSVESERTAFYYRTTPVIKGSLKGSMSVDTKASVVFDVLDYDTGMPMNKRTNYWKEQGSYNTEVVVYDPNGNLVASKVFSKADHGELSFTIKEIGEYEYVINPYFLSDPFTKVGTFYAKEAINTNRVTLSSAFTKIDGGYKIPYSGNHMIAEPIVTDRKGNKLVKNRDYTVTYSASKRVEVKKYTFTVKGIGDYQGSVTKKMVIVPKLPEKLHSRLALGQGCYDDIYTYWEPSHGASGYFVYYKRTDRTADWSYIGRTSKTNFLQKDLADGYTYQFKIIPFYEEDGIRYKSVSFKYATATTLKKVNLTSVKKFNNSSVRIYFDNIKGESGYQFSRALSKDGTYIVDTYNSTTMTYRTLNTPRNKIYYYKVRAYKTITKEGKNYKVFGPWSYVKQHKLI